MKSNRFSEAKNLFFLSTGLLLSTLAPAQVPPDSTRLDSVQNRPYHVVRLRGDVQTLRSSFGLGSFKFPLYRVTDSTVSVLRARRLTPQAEIVTVPVRLIDELRIQRSTQRGGAGRGFLIGVATGALIGLISGDDHNGFIEFTAGQKALAFALPCGLTGLIVGGIISSHSLKIPLGRSQTKLAAERKPLQPYTLKPD